MGQLGGGSPVAERAAAGHLLRACAGRSRRQRLLSACCGASSRRSRRRATWCDQAAAPRHRAPRRSVPSSLPRRACPRLPPSGCRLLEQLRARLEGLAPRGGSPTRHDRTAYSRSPEDGRSIRQDRGPARDSAASRARIGRSDDTRGRNATTIASVGVRWCSSPREHRLRDPRSEHHEEHYQGSASRHPAPAPSPP